jgi:hypothetical protein
LNDRSISGKIAATYAAAGRTSCPWPGAGSHARRWTEVEQLV